LLLVGSIGIGTRPAPAPLSSELGDVRPVIGELAPRADTADAAFTLTLTPTPAAAAAAGDMAPGPDSTPPSSSGRLSELARAMKRKLDVGVAPAAAKDADVTGDARAPLTGKLARTRGEDTPGVRPGTETAPAAPAAEVSSLTLLLLLLLLVVLELAVAALSDMLLAALPAPLPLPPPLTPEAVLAPDMVAVSADTGSGIPAAEAAALAAAAEVATGDPGPLLTPSEVAADVDVEDSDENVNAPPAPADTLAGTAGVAEPVRPGARGGRPPSGSDSAEPAEEPLPPAPTELGGAEGVAAVPAMPAPLTPEPAAAPCPVWPDTERVSPK